MELAATRFAAWTIFLAISMAYGLITLTRIRREWPPSPVLVALLGLSLDGMAFAGHQMWWWAREHLVAVGHCKSDDPLLYNVSVCSRADWFLANDHITHWFYAVWFVGIILAANVITRHIPVVGRVWFAASATFIGCLWGIGAGLVALRIGA